MKPFTVVIETLDTPNRNGRIYTKESMVKTIGKKSEILGGIGMFVENGMMNLEKVSHTVTNLRIEGDKLIGEITILKTPMGGVLRGALINDIDCVRFAIRGNGVIDHDGVVHDFSVISIDAITQENGIQPMQTTNF
jgi:hypothetical protein